MTNSNNRFALLKFPFMQNDSYKKVTLSPSQARLTLSYGHSVRSLTAQEVAQLAFVSVPTAYKWIAGTHPMNPATRHLLHYRALGILPHPKWSDWHLDEHGKLIAGNGYSFYPDELVNFAYIKQHNGALAAEVARLKLEIRQLHDAIAYFQERPLANVVRFPSRQPKPQAQKKPG